MILGVEILKLECKIKIDETKGFTLYDQNISRLTLTVTQRHLTFRMEKINKLYTKV